MENSIKIQEFRLSKFHKQLISAAFYVFLAMGISSVLLQFVSCNQDLCTGNPLKNDSSLAA